MALFQKKVQADQAPLYTLGQQKTVLIVGLGNPGREYAHTRHNIGFRAVDSFAKQQAMPGWVNKKDLQCHLTSGTVIDTRVLVIKPTTFMNLSGQSVAAVANFYKLAPSQILVVHDELDIPFGQIRLRTGGSDAGNNGVKSIIQHLDEGFGRVRIGVENRHIKTEKAKQPSADFVLEKFSVDEEKQLPDLIKEVNAILMEYLAVGSLPHDTRQWLLEE